MTKQLSLLVVIGCFIFDNLWSQETKAGLVCCCGVWNQVFYPNFDFEDGPAPAPGSFITYSAGASFGGWTVTRATIDHVDGAHAGLGNGNPNGASNFIDLHGSPGFGGISYKLTNLKPGAVYLLKFWTAQNGGNHSSTGTVTVAGGAWMNESWTVTISGSVAWFLMEFKFMAMADMADLEFSSVGDQAYAGTLIDDISLFECPPDIELPVIVNEPIDEDYNCLSDVKKPPTLTATDDCDLSPTIKLTEKVNKESDCEITILREWIVSDDCNNTKTITQEVKVFDKEAPTITNVGSDKIVFCNSFKLTDFNSWLAIQGGTKATDNCKSVTWDYSYDKVPEAKCDTTIVTFIAKDICGNETFNYLNFIVRDTSRPLAIKKADTSVLKCSSSSRDSLRSWLIKHGNAQAIDSCSSVFWSNNFNGDSTALTIQVNFTAEDSCGNKTVIPGLFLQLDSPDTFNITSYQCGLKGIKVDTTFHVLPGCDSVVIHRQIGVNMDSTQLFYKTCDINQIPREIFSLKNQFNCDSTVFINYQYIPPDSNFLEKIICGLKDTIITVQKYTGLFCDSIVIESQIPSPEYSISINNKSCDPLKAGIDTFRYKSLGGCDSVVIIVTELSTSTYTSQDSFICGLNKDYIDTLEFTTQNCDSFHIVSFKGLKRDTTIINSITCDPSEAGIKIRTALGINNCDSTIIENIQLQSVQNYVSTKVSCYQLQKPIDTAVEESYLGCDSLIITHYILKAIDTTRIFQTTCDKSLAPLEILKLKGEYCDSIVVINRSYQPSIVQNIQLTTCHKDSVSTDTLRYITAQRCDSSIIIQKIYKAISFKYSHTDISCFGYNDSRFELLELNDAKEPIELIIDGNIYKNQKIISPLGKGIHTVFIKDQTDCVSDSLQFVINEPLELTVDLGPDIQLNRPENITLKDKSGNNYFNYQWLPSSLFNCDNCTNPVASIQVDTTIFLVVMDSNGCSATDTLNIRILKIGDVFAPNTFSPNGDGINDEFYLSGDENISVQYLRIYDRWGNLVFDRINPKINQAHDGWNGLYKAQVLNPGVFVYSYSILSPNGDHIIRSGDLTLMK